MGRNVNPPLIWVSGEGIVDRVVEENRVWRVRFQGSYWSAEAETPLSLIPGDLVRVVGRRNITLLVEPLGKPFLEPIAACDRN